jgi:hypothetical protein
VVTTPAQTIFLTAVVLGLLSWGIVALVRGAWATGPVQDPDDGDWVGDWGEDDDEPWPGADWVAGNDFDDDTPAPAPTTVYIVTGVDTDELPAAGLWPDPPPMTPPVRAEASIFRELATSRGFRLPSHRERTS